MVKRKRIWVLAKGYRPDAGGMQTYARSVAHAYADLGWDVTVYTQTSIGPRDDEEGGIRLRDVGPGRGPDVPFRFLKAMRRDLREAGEPTLVHATTWRTGVLPSLLRLPFLVTVHGREILYPRGLVAAAMRQVLRQAARIVAVSDATRTALLGRAPSCANKVVTAWNGVSAGVSPPSDGRTGDLPPTVMTLCRLEPRKNVLAALAALDACARRGARFRYVLCGTGPERERIEAAVRETSIADRVEILGYVPDERAIELYRAADIFLHPQIALDGGRDFEGFGIAIADAMASGAAPIVGRDGGSAEIVADGVTGRVVDGRDEPALAGVLEALLADGEETGGRGAAAAGFAAAKFSWRSHCVDALRDLG